MENEKPFLANGSLVGDYKPLIMYWRLARKVSKELADKAVLNHEDFRELENIIRRYYRKPLTEIVDLFKNRFKQRINAEIAVKALKEVYGVEFSSEEAVEKIAEIMSLWLLDAAKQLNIIYYRNWWKKD